MKKEIYLVKRNERVLLGKYNNSMMSGLWFKKKYKEKFPILENSSYESYYNEGFEKEIIEFTPFIEVSFEKLHKLIFSKNFGDIKLCNNFLEHTKALSPITKALTILNHLVELEPVANVLTPFAEISTTVPSPVSLLFITVT
jgi:hypothetical protein